MMDGSNAETFEHVFADDTGNGYAKSRSFSTVSLPMLDGNNRDNLRNCQLVRGKDNGGKELTHASPVIVICVNGSGRS